MAPMHVNTCREVPEYEIDPKELDFTNSIELSKVIYFVLILVSCRKGSLGLTGKVAAK